VAPVHRPPIPASADDVDNTGATNRREKQGHWGSLIQPAGGEKMKQRSSNWFMAVGWSLSAV
jgi:hypothetical protein